ncbi:hypothetical protein [Miltoncostaea oceani]|uniref:hypothetical protein n=1 Tax=Miltoncostaea oceani TaxID=2843216 RepID=UPI001C3D72D3|nr:hypothetical protein [Miltoncostaea oceani]
MARLIADAGLLVAADRNERAAWALKKAAAEDRDELVVPAVALAQTWRGPQSANLARFLKGLRVIPLDAELARTTGHLLGVAATSDIADAAVAACAMEGDRIITGDLDDISQLVELRGVRAEVRTI